MGNDQPKGPQSPIPNPQQKNSINTIYYLILFLNININYFYLNI